MDVLEGCSSAQGDVVLEIGAEGGSLRVLVQDITELQFAVLLNDQSLAFIDEGPAISHQTAWGSWEAAVDALDRYPWRHLRPMAVHPAYSDRIWDLVQTGPDELRASRLQHWAEQCGRHPREHQRDEINEKGYGP